MKDKAALQPKTLDTVVIGLEKEERKALNRVLCYRGSLKLMSEGTGLRRETITRIKLKGHGEARIVNKIRGYLAAKAAEQAQTTIS